MPSIAAQYEAKTTGEGSAPSGQSFKWRTATPMDTAAIYGGMPGLAKMAEGKIDEGALLKAVEYNEKLIARCVTYPKIVRNGDAEPEGDWLPVHVIDQPDMNWLVARILGAYRSPAADAAKEAL